MHVLQTLALTDAGVAAGLGGTALFIFFVIGLLSVFWIWMLIDCLTSNLPPVEKIIWCLVIFWLHFIGAILYFVMGRTGGRMNMA